MSVADLDACPKCNMLWRHEQDGRLYSKLIGVEYPYDMSEHYNGISEWECPFCHTRWGRWTGRVLTGDEYEPRYGGRRWKT